MADDPTSDVIANDAPMSIVSFPWFELHFCYERSSRQRCGQSIMNISA